MPSLHSSPSRRVMVQVSLSAETVYFSAICGWTLRSASLANSDVVDHVAEVAGDQRGGPDRVEDLDVGVAHHAQRRLGHRRRGHRCPYQPGARAARLRKPRMNSTLRSFANFRCCVRIEAMSMPTVFVSHGSPTLILEDLPGAGFPGDARLAAAAAQGDRRGLRPLEHRAAGRLDRRAAGDDPRFLRLPGRLSTACTTTRRARRNWRSGWRS